MLDDEFFDVDVHGEDCIRTGLEQLRRGEFYTGFGLSETTDLLNDPNFQNEEHNFNRFLQATADSYVKEKNVTQKKKKHVSFVNQLLQQKKDEWIGLIQSIDSLATPSPNNISSSPEPKTEMDKDNENVAMETQTEKVTASRSHQVPEGKVIKKKRGRKPGKKRPQQPSAPSPLPPASSPPQKRKKKKMSREEAEKLRLQKIKEFEDERDQILNDIPASVKEKFGTIGFSKWNKVSLPVLLLNPFSVPPGPVRDEWFKMYDKVKSNNRLSKMTNLVYWYGSWEDPDNAYSFVPSKNITSYEDGVKKGLDKIPAAVAKKIAEKKKLHQNFQQLVAGLEEMAEDLEKPPPDRCGRMDQDWIEVYDISDDESEGILENDDDDGSGSILADDVPTSAPNELYTNSENVHDIRANENRSKIDDDLLPLTHEPKKKKKKKKIKSDDLSEQPKGKKRKRDKRPIDGAIVETPNEMPKKKKIKKQQQDGYDGEKQQIGVETAQQNDDYIVEHGTRNDPDDDVMMEPIPSDDDKDDDEIIPSDDEDDEEFELDDKPRTSKRRTKKVKKSDRGKETKKEEISHPNQEENSFSGVKKQKQKEVKLQKPNKPPSLKKRFQLEQEAFENCEKNFGPLIQTWQKAVDNQDVATTMDCLEKVFSVVESFTAPFIEEFNIAPLMKSTKQISDSQIRKQLWNRLKHDYKKKKELVPKGFKVMRQHPTKSTQSVLDNSATEGEKERDTTVDSKQNDNCHGVQTEDITADTLMLETSKQENQKEAKDERPDVTESNANNAQSLPPTKVAKPDRKKFSLGSLMRSSSSNKTQKDPVTTTKHTASSSKSQVSRELKLPRWMTEDIKDIPEQRSDKNRAFALQFLVQAVQFIPRSEPHNQPINYDGIALGLEAAVFDWSQKQTSTKRRKLFYWQKIHDVVAAISGKRGVGTLAKLIGDGQLPSPKSVVDLSDENIFASVEGATLVL